MRDLNRTNARWRRIVRARSTQLIAPFLVYVVSSAMLFGLSVLPHPKTRYFGWGVDPSSIVWFMKWWPYAIGHGLNPFVTHIVWAPSGANLAGTTSIPGLALLGAPLTLVAGPIVAYNVLYVLAPAVSAWAAYLLCRHLTGRVLPSLVGGYLYGFSSYELSKMLGHLNLAFVAIPPLCVLVVLLRMEVKLTNLRFVVLLTALLSLEFLVSTETFFTLTLFGFIAYLMAIVGLGHERARALAATGGWILVSYGVSMVLLAPYLFYVVKGLGQAPIYDFYPRFYSTDLLNFVVPTPVTRVGWESFVGISARFSGNIGEQGAYLGFPLLAIVLLFAWEERRTFAAKFLPVFLGVVMVATLGPKLHIKGKEEFALPWKPFSTLPLAKYALPGRFMVYAFLALAVLVALWLASARTSAVAKWALVPAAILLLLPNWRAEFFNSPVNIPPFFQAGIYRRYLSPGENVIVMPYGDRGHSMLWQAETGMYFRMAGGYVTVRPPKAFRNWPILPTLYGAISDPDPEEDLKSFLGANRVTAILVADPGAAMVPIFAFLDPRPVHVAGVTVFRVPADVLHDYANARPLPG